MQIQKSIQQDGLKIEEQQTKHFGKFSIFLLIKTAHNNYGIKNTDYERYRKYCSRKVQKIRKSMGYKYGNKTKFIKKDIIKQKANDHKILQVALFNCEKYWAQSNETKFSSQRKPSHKSRARFFSIKKLKKAIQWSSKLCDICDEKTDYSTKLESNAYKFYLEGMLSFEQQKWNDAQIKLIAAREIMEDLKKKSDSLSESIFKQKIDQLDQTIKFCNFKISKGKDMPISEIIQMKKLGDANLSSLIENLTQQRLNQISLEQTSQNNKQIKFGEERYPVKQQKILVQKTKIDSQLKTLQQIKTKSFSNIEDEQLYEELLTFYSNIVVLIEEGSKLTDQERQDGKKSDKYTEGELQILKKISLLFQKLKITLFIDRSFTIFKHSYNTNKGRKSTPQTLAKLLTATINNFTHLTEIIREKGNISTALLESQIQSIQEKIFYLRTLRLLFVGQVYFNNSKIKQAFSLWNQCQRCMNILTSKQEMKNQKQKNIQQQDFIKCDLVPLQKMESQLKQFKLKAIIENHKNQSQSKGQITKMMGEINVKGQNQNIQHITLESLINQNNQTSFVTLQKMSEINLVQLPGNLQLLPTRPIFFDIYDSEIKYPSLDGKIKQKKGGFMGLFKNFLK